MLILATMGRAADAGKDAKWEDISDPVIKQLEKEGKKIEWPGVTAGVTVDAASGAVYMIVPGQGIWVSADSGKTFARADGGEVGGRCETSYALCPDPAGGRLACFMLDGACAMTGDGGKTWSRFKDVGRNWDYAAVDWSAKEAKTIFAARHEFGGEVYISRDAGQSWDKLFADPEFEQSGGLGIFEDQTLVYTQKGKGIQRSTDGGKNWKKVSDLEPWGRVVRVHKGVGWWLSRDGLLVSKDKGATWEKQGAAVEATIGPMFDLKDEKHLVAAGVKGIFETVDGGATWKAVASLPAEFDMPKAGWFSNVAWDPERGVFYASRMGKPTYRMTTANTR